MAAAEPSNLHLFEEISRRTGHRVQVAAAAAGELTAAVESWLHSEVITLGRSKVGLPAATPEATV